jgi:hypothetical protein
MQKITVRGIVKACPYSGRTWAGYVAEGVVVPGNLTETPVEVLDPQDGSGNYWVLAHPVTIGLIDGAGLTALSANELRRQTIAKLSDAELTSLGLTRE